MLGITDRPCPGSELLVAESGPARSPVGSMVGRCPVCAMSFELGYAGRLPRHAPIRLALSSHQLIDPALRESLEQEAGIVVGLETAPGEFLAALPRARADVVVVDVLTGCSSPAATIPEIGAASPGSRIVVVSTQESSGCVRKVLSEGARGYVLKASPVDRFLTAIRTVHAGSMYIDPSVIPS